MAEAEATGVSECDEDGVTMTSNLWMILKILLTRSRCGMSVGSGVVIFLFIAIHHYDVD